MLVKSSRGYENSLRIREEIQGAHGGRSGFKKGQETQLKIKRPVTELMLGKWRIKGTAQMAFGPELRYLSCD